jgi:rhodanese-related sulfurtransferase
MEEFMAEKRSTRLKGFIPALALSLLVLAAGAGCGKRGEPAAGGTTNHSSSTPATAEPGALPAGEAKAFIAAHPGVLVLDVRNPDEWNDDLGHIDGARQVPLPELEARLGELAEYREKPVVAVCRSGGRSAQAAEMLVKAGFKQVWNLEGGMQAWRQAGN